jgi:zinc-ribbon domain
VTQPAEILPAAPPPSSAGSSSWGWVRRWLIPLGAAVAALLYGLFGADLRPGAALLILTLGGLGLALCGLALFRVLDPLFRPTAAAQRTEKAAESTRLRELEREKQLVLKAIREIEHDFQMRKISEADHREMTQRYRGRALRLINQIDAGDDFRTLIEQELKSRLGALEAARAACSACGTPNEPDARFCKKCGQGLGPASADKPS